MKHYSYRTEQSYIDWIERYLRYHNGDRPQTNCCSSQ
ncbi:phage integrase N-terminal SAM-like domain-containing protein [Picosynechococcus sp. NKBG15041c]